MNILGRLALRFLKEKRGCNGFLIPDEDMTEAISYLTDIMWNRFNQNDGVMTADMHAIREELSHWLPEFSVRFMYKEMGGME